MKIRAPFPFVRLFFPVSEHPFDNSLVNDGKAIVLGENGLGRELGNNSRQTSSSIVTCDFLFRVNSIFFFLSQVLLP